MIKKTPTLSKENFEQVESPLAQNRKSKWLWLFLGLTILGSGSVSWRWLKQKNASVPTENKFSPVISVRLQQLETSTIKNSSEFVGILEAQQRVNLRPETNGRIAEILISSGEKVNQGTPLIRLRPGKNRAQLNSAIARSKSLQAALKQAELELRVFEAEQSSQAAELKLQKEEFKRTSFLVTEGAQSAQALDLVKRNLQAALANFEAAQKRVQAAEAKINAANADLRQAEANVDLERENLRDTEVVAPVAGIIGDISAKIGDYVETTNSLTTITQNQTLELRFTVPIEYITKLRIGLPVELRTSQGGDPLVVGKISFISPRVDQTSQTVLAKAHFSNSQGKLRDEQFVRARVIWEQKPGILIPTKSVNTVGGQRFVFVAKEENFQNGKSFLVARQIPVEVGKIQGQQYQVISGIQTGEKIITSGILNLSDGIQVKEVSLTSKNNK